MIPIDFDHRQATAVNSDAVAQTGIRRDLPSCDSQAASGIRGHDSLNPPQLLYDSCEHLFFAFHNEWTIISAICNCESPERISQHVVSIT